MITVTVTAPRHHPDGSFIGTWKTYHVFLTLAEAQTFAASVTGTVEISS